MESTSSQQSSPTTENLGKTAEKPTEQQWIEVSASEILCLRSIKLGSLLVGS